MTLCLNALLSLVLMVNLSTFGDIFWDLFAVVDESRCKNILSFVLYSDIFIQIRISWLSRILIKHFWNKSSNSQETYEKLTKYLKTSWTVKFYFIQ